MMKLLIKVFRGIRHLPRMIYFNNKVRSLFPRKILRYIDWFIIRDNVRIYSGKSLKQAIAELFSTPPYQLKLKKKINRGRLKILQGAFLNTEQRRVTISCLDSILLIPQRNHVPLLSLTGTRMIF